MSIDIDVGDVHGLEDRLQRLDNRIRWLVMAMSGEDGFLQALAEEISEEIGFRWRDVTVVARRDTARTGTLRCGLKIADRYCGQAFPRQREVMLDDLRARVAACVDCSFVLQIRRLKEDFDLTVVVESAG